jgi:glycosyltransferase involved in cell wall biosynthesis
MTEPQKNKCCICGPVKNCGLYLEKVLENIEKIGSLFEDYRIILFYDKSTDNSLQILKKIQTKNPRLSFFVNKAPLSKFRTHNIAFARNFCLKQIKEKYADFPYFIMMDFDNVNCKTVRPEILEKYLNLDTWDALSFQTNPFYYDIWGLSIYPYCFSYNHFKNNVKQYDVIQKYVETKLKKLNKDNLELLPCLSAFNGFSIYRTSLFLDCTYDGKIRMDLVPKKAILTHSFVTRSPLVYKKYETVDGRYEDCEHRAFHMQAVFQKGAKIRISPEILFF